MWPTASQARSILIPVALRVVIRLLKSKLSSSTNDTSGHAFQCRQEQRDRPEARCQGRQNHDADSRMAVLLMSSGTVAKFVKSFLVAVHHAPYQTTYLLVWPGNSSSCRDSQKTCSSWLRRSRHGACHRPNCNTDNTY